MFNITTEGKCKVKNFFLNLTHYQVFLTRELFPLIKSLKKFNLLFLNKHLFSNQSSEFIYI